MKKRILFLSFLFLFVFSACTFFNNSKEDVSYLRFSVKDDASNGTQSQEVQISFQPDYELRTMSVKYSLIFPYKTDVTENSDISNEGVIGGEFFDRFEKILDATKKDIWNKQKDSTAPTFIISVEKENGEIKDYDLYAVEDEEVFKTIEQFYLDVIDLFSQDVY